jgi:hypothetical protein
MGISNEFSIFRQQLILVVYRRSGNKVPNSFLEAEMSRRMKRRQDVHVSSGTGMGRVMVRS